MEYIKVSEAAKNWGITPRRVRILCAEGKIDGVTRKGKLYMIPANAMKPMDGRMSRTSFLTEIERKQNELSKLRPLTPGEVARLAEEFIVEYTYDSNAIEGNTLTLRETAMVLQGMTIDQKPLKDHLEAVGHKEAFYYVERLAKEVTPLSDFIIKNIHSFVLMDRTEDKGVYRRIPVRIAGAATEPVQPYLIEPKITDLILANEERKQTMPFVERIARFHLEFEGIHPFIDGNGRTGRLILNFELIQNGYPPIDIKFADRMKYYNAFDSYYRDGSADAMIDLIAGYVNESLDRYYEILK